MLDAPSLTTATHGCVWIHSDLQLAKPELARQVLASAVDDILDLDLDIAATWCLGDALSGSNEPALDEVADTCISQMERLAVPICYVMGNHEMDLRRVGISKFPLLERAMQHPQWHTQADPQDFYFARRFFGSLVVFMGDHRSSHGHWWSTHGLLQDLDLRHYPHMPQAYEALRQEMANHPGPVVTASHYAYPGGQRPSALMAQLLPLPDNVRLHVYGHAHIGDLVHNKLHPYRRNNPIEGQALRQFNISALETVRSAGSHSAILEFGPDGPTTLRIRCHLERQWTESFDIPAINPPLAAR